jgi:hypothetical protein
MRQVLQYDGQLVVKEGPRFRRLPVAKADLQKLWEGCYWGAVSNGERTASQALAWFGKQAMEKTNRFCRPDPSWPFVPKFINDHKLPMKAIPKERLSWVPQKGQPRSERNLF